MIYLDRVRVPLERVKDIGCDLEDFGIRNHGVVGACNVEIALVELPHAALGHGRLVAAVHLGNLVALEALHTRVHGEPSCERDSKIVAQRAKLPALILQVINEFRVLSIFAAQNLLEFEDGCVECGGSVALKDVGHGLEETIAESGVFASPWCRQHVVRQQMRTKTQDIQSRVPFGTFKLKLLLLSSLPISSSSKGEACVQSRRRGVKSRTRRGVGLILP